MYVMKANIIVNNSLICTVTRNTRERRRNVLNNSVLNRSGKRRAEMKHLKDLARKLYTSVTAVTTSFKRKQQFQYMKHPSVLAKVAYKKYLFTNSVGREQRSKS